LTPRFPGGTRPPARRPAAGGKKNGKKRALLLFAFGLLVLSGRLIMNTFLAIGGLGGGDIVVIAVAVLVLFGAKKIPEFAKGLGQGIREFKKASREVTDEINNAANAAPPPPAKPAPPAEPAAPNPPATVPKA
jgi:sec-independent protein translocase protein TatA